MQRICFVLKVRKEWIAQYKLRHASVWPNLLAALHETGWHNYSIFLREDGLLIGYCETPDFKQAIEGMKRYQVNSMWQEQMAPFFESLDSGAADDSMVGLEEIFHLD